MWKGRVYYGIELTSNLLSLTAVRRHSECGMELLGGATRPMKGFRKGRLVNEDVFVNALRNLHAQATGQQRRRSGPVSVALAGHICDVRRLRGTLTARRHADDFHGEISRLLQESAANQLAGSRMVLEVLPVHGEIVEETNDRVIVDTEALVVSFDMELAEALQGALKRAGLGPVTFVYGPQARLHLLTTEVERHYGLNFIHLGARTTTLMAYQDGICQHCEIYPAGSEILASDIAYMLQTGQDEARQLLDDERSFDEEAEAKNMILSVPSIGAGGYKRVSQGVIFEIVRARMVELLQDFKKTFDRTPSEGGQRRITLLSGNLAHLPGIYSFAQRVLDMPVGPGSVAEFPGDTTILDDPQLYGSLGACLAYPELRMEETHDDEDIQAV